LTIASSISSPPVRIDCETTIPHERDDRHLGCAAADVHDHVPGRLGNGQPGADRGCHRLLDQVGLPCPGRERRLLDGALLDASDSGGNAYDDARMREAMLVHLLNEVPEHLLGDIEVGDDSVLQGTNGGDCPRRPTKHPLRFDPDGVNLARALVDCNHRGLRQDDAAAADVDKGVRSTEVHSHVTATKTGQRVHPAHRRPECS